MLYKGVIMLMKKIVFLLIGLVISNCAIGMEAPEEGEEQRIFEERLLKLDPELQAMVFDQALMQRLEQTINGKIEKILHGGPPIYFYLGKSSEIQAYEEYQKQRDEDQKLIDEVTKLIGAKRQGNFLLHSDQRQRYLTKLAKAVFLSTGESLPIETLQVLQNVFEIDAKEAEALQEEIEKFNTSIGEIFAYGIFRKVVGEPTELGKTNWNVKRLALNRLYLSDISRLDRTGVENERVQSIDLSGNNIEALPADIADILQQFPNLKEIDFNDNPIAQTEEGQAQIAALQGLFPKVKFIID